MYVRYQAILVSRELRKNMTTAEIIFWRKVRNKKFYGFKFLRQHPIFYDYWSKKKFFIADFYCRELNLIVEIDGGIHEKQKEYDRIRTEILQRHKNLKIIRFKNEEVVSNIELVLQKLKEVIENPPPAPPC